MKHLFNMEQPKICRIAFKCNVKMLKDYKTLKKDSIYRCVSIGYSADGRPFRILKELKTLEQKEIKVYNKTINELWDKDYFYTLDKNLQ